MIKVLDRYLSEYVSVRPNRAVYYLRDDCSGNNNYNKSKGILLTGMGAKIHDKGYEISRKTLTRISDVVNALLFVSKPKKIIQKSSGKTFFFKINFITLTLSKKQRHDDSDIYNKIFRPFLRKLKYKYPSLLYLWKAESQDNGNIHFHLTTNTYINALYLRRLWNKCQSALSYIVPGVDDNVNSTDVHAVYKINNIAGYLTKYISKGDLYKKPLKRYFKRYGKILKNKQDGSCVLPQRYFLNIKRKIDIIDWNCSVPLKNKKTSIELCDNEVNQSLTFLKNKSKTIKHLDYCSLFYFEQKDFEKSGYMFDYLCDVYREAMLLEAQQASVFVDVLF